MKPVTADWGQYISAPTRRTTLVIHFPFVDPDAKDSATIESCPTESKMSHVSQVIDEVYPMVGPLAQFEPDYWRLDGTFMLPLPSGSTESQTGYWSQALSGADGTWSQPLTIRFTFSKPISVPGLTFYFDTKTGECPKDFDYVFYDEDLVEIRAVEVRENTEAHLAVSKGAALFKILDLVFYTSSNPYRRLRLLEIDFGIMIVFDDSNLFSVELISECDPLSESIPSNEFNLTAVNDGSFDYAAEDSYAQYLQRRQEFQYNHYLVLSDDPTIMLSPDAPKEHVNMGTYLLDSWKVSDNKIELKAQLGFQQLEKHIFRCQSIVSKMNAGQALEAIFSDAGWTDYQIDSYLYDSPMFYPYVGEATGKEALRYIAFMAGAVVLKQPDGVIAIKRLDLDAKAAGAITYDTALAVPAAESTTYYNTIRLPTYVILPKETPEDAPITRYSGVVNSDDPVTIWVPHDYILADSNPMRSFTGATLISQANYAKHSKIVIRGHGTYTYTITGQTADINSSADYVIGADWMQKGEPEYPHVLDVPMMFQDSGLTALMDWATTERFRVLGHRLMVDTQWRQDPSLDIGDMLTLQLDKNGQTNKVYASRHTLSYTGGGLSGTTRMYGQGRRGT